MPLDDRGLGLYTKYKVERLDDPKGKHLDCFFFVLDWDHDPYAVPAARAYARACKDEFPKLAEDLLKEADYHEDRWKKQGRFMKCTACSIEAEIGTEEYPHPVPERFHTCRPVRT